MDIKERHKRLRDFYQESLDDTSKLKFCELYGVSNSAQVVENGIQIGNANLNSVLDPPQSYAFSCVFKLPPEDEVYFAVHVKHEAELFTEILCEMKERAGSVVLSGRYKFNNNNKNVKIGLAQNGRLYLKNIGQWDTLDLDFSAIGGKTSQGVSVDKITVAVYPPHTSARRSLAVSEFIGFLGKVVGKEKVHEIIAWPEESKVSIDMQRSPRSLSVADIRNSIERLGGHYNDDLVERFHTGLNYLASKRFVILGGISGTGKTNLVLQYARAVHGIGTMEEEDPLLFICPVRPEWTDPTGLSGHHDILTDRYIVPTFLEAVLVAISNPLSPVFICLDEMNLARVEYYFSDVLSCIETGARLKLHSSSVPLEASTGGDVCAEIPLPPNLYIIGTINIDETTNPLSDKVLDRAVYLDMSKVDLENFHKKLKKNQPELEVSVDKCGLLMEEINKILESHNQGFGYRMANECIRFHHYSTTEVGRSSDQVVDELLVQKVLVKLRGSEYQRNMLAELGRILAPYPRATNVINALETDLNQLGSFQNTR